MRTRKESDVDIPPQLFCLIPELKYPVVTINHLLKALIHIRSTPTKQKSTLLLEDRRPTTNKQKLQWTECLLIALYIIIISHYQFSVHHKKPQKPSQRRMTMFKVAGGRIGWPCLYLVSHLNIVIVSVSLNTTTAC